MKRHLLLGRKAMTKLGSIFKSRDITLPTKFHLVKAMIYPVVLYKCESWTIKEGWELKNRWFQIVVLKNALKSPLDSKDIKPVNPKGVNPKCSLEGLVLKLKLQYFGHLMWRADSLKTTLMLGNTEGRKGRGWQIMRWLDGITNSVDLNLSKLR